MKKTFACIFTLVLLVVAPAQDLPVGNPRNDEFRKYFVAVLEANPAIKNFNRMPVGAEYNLPNGEVDRLTQDDVNGIWDREFKKFYNMPMYVDPSPARTTSITEGELAGRVDQKSYTTAMLWKDYGWLLKYIIGGLILLFLVWRSLLSFSHPRRWQVDFSEDEESWEEREFSLDPVTSGRPYVYGGIEPNETGRLENFLYERARDLYRRRNPNLGFDFYLERVGPIQIGTIHGEGLVGYLGSELKPRRIPEPGIRAYQARYRFADDTEEILQTLQACMNPVYSGDTYKGFIFTEDKPIVSDEDCRGKNSASVEQGADFFGDTTPVVLRKVDSNTCPIVDSISQLHEHEGGGRFGYQSGGGHRARRFQGKIFSDEY